MPDRPLPEKALTIGALARRAGVTTSMLRFYEREGLLKPAGRTTAGYRIYPASAEDTLRFIRRAQRLGFSLSDIKLLLREDGARGQNREDVMDLAQQRFLDIERRLTDMLVLRHELEFFLDDLTERLGRAAGGASGALYRELLEQVCGHEAATRSPSSLHKLMERLGCALAGAEQDRVFDALRGRHLHVWRDDDGYSILFPGREPAVEAALRRLAASEAACEAHLAPRVTEAEDGYLFQARGPNAFLFAQLFLALESADA